MSRCSDNGKALRSLRDDTSAVLRDRRMARPRHQTTMQSATFLAHRRATSVKYRNVKL